MRPVIVVLGPTATGKSALAMTIAERFDGEIVNADALQVYRGLDIGTAKPPPEDRARIRHHLVDILNPQEAFSAGEFARRARAAIVDIQSRHKPALVVGGSGFYIRTLLDGLSPIPQIPQAVRRDLKKRAESEGLEALRGELRRVDPETERRLGRRDTQRVVRALEVWTATGRTLSSWIQEEPRDERLQAIRVGLTLARGLLYDRIAERIREMVDKGWVEEVRRLLATGLEGTEPAFQAIGYRQLVGHLRHGSSLSEVITEIVASTRRYAKRQLTWFRRDGDIDWFMATEPEKLAQAVITDLSDALQSQGDA